MVHSSFQWLDPQLSGVGMYQFLHGYMGTRLLVSCGGMHKTSLLFVVTICLVTTICDICFTKKENSLSAITAASYRVDQQLFSLSPSHVCFWYVISSCFHGTGPRQCLYPYYLRLFIHKLFHPLQLLQSTIATLSTFRYRSGKGVNFSQKNEDGKRVKKD